jgi:hypothetical protein
VRVEERLPSWYEIRITDGVFNIMSWEGRMFEGLVIKSGDYPADYPTALLELVKTLYEGKEKDRK